MLELVWLQISRYFFSNGKKYWLLNVLSNALLTLSKSCKKEKRFLKFFDHTRITLLACVADFWAISSIKVFVICQKAFFPFFCKKRSSTNKTFTVQYNPFSTHLFALLQIIIAYCGQNNFFLHTFNFLWKYFFFAISKHFPAF